MLETLWKRNKTSGAAEVSGGIGFYILDRNVLRDPVKPVKRYAYIPQADYYNILLCENV